MKYTILVITIFLFSVSLNAKSPLKKVLDADRNTVMTQEAMETIVKEMSLASKGGQGVVEFVYNDVKLYLVSDVKHDRMRIITPVAKYEDLTQEHIDAIMVSNFHNALDARYAVSEGVLYAAYIHPMSKLDKAQIKSAVEQVVNLRLTFGNGYSSGALSYGEHQ